VNCMKKSLKDILLLLWYFLSTFLVVFIVFFIIAYVFKNGMHTINKDFLLDNPKGMPIVKKGGIFPAIIGSLLLMFISSITASILGIATAVYLTLYNKNKKIDSIIHIIIHSISDSIYSFRSIWIFIFGILFRFRSISFSRSYHFIHNDFSIYRSGYRKGYRGSR